MTVRRERGKDGVLTVNDQQVPFTNCSFTCEYEITTNDWNDDFFQYKSVISGTASGSFEFTGSVPDAAGQLMNSGADDFSSDRVQSDAYPRIQSALTVELEEESFHASRLIITSYEREAPADDNTTGTVEWEAEQFTFNPQ